MAVNFSISIPSHLIDWLYKKAESKKLYTNGKPSINKAASVILEELYKKEKEGK